MAKSNKFYKFKKLMKNNDFVICISVYPAAFLIFIFLSIYLRVSFEFRRNSALWYSFATFGIFFLFAISMVFERIERAIFFKGQGDKLKMKQSDDDWRK